MPKFNTIITGITQNPDGSLTFSTSGTFTGDVSARSYRVANTNTYNAFPLYGRGEDVAPRGLVFDIGATLLTWTNSVLSAGIAVFPSLGGRFTSLVVATARDSPGPGFVPVVNIFNFGEGVFGMNAETRNPFTGSINIQWLAFAA